MAAPANPDLYAQFFGGDDDSELSDIEEDQEAPAQQADSPVAAGLASPSGDDGDGEQDDDDDDDAAVGGRRRREEDEDYDAGPEADLSSMRSYKKKKDGKEPSRKKKKKKVKSTATVDEGDAGLGDADPVPELTAAERARLDLSQKLDAAIKAPKTTRKRKRKADEDDISLLYDEEVAKLDMLMKDASHRDRDSLADGLPAIHKLQMLNQVVATMQKAHLHEAITESTVLSQVKLWLEPGDGSVLFALPSITIQRSLLHLLTDLQLDTETVKRNELGKIANFYSKCKRVDPAIRREADKLVMTWMRPIIRRSSSYRDKPIQVVEQALEENERERERSQRRRQLGLGAGAAAAGRGGLGASQSQSQRQGGAGGEQSQRDIARRHAMIPQAVSTNFTVAPRSRVEEETAKRIGGTGRFGHFKKKLQMSQSSSKKL